MQCSPRSSFVFNPPSTSRTMSFPSSSLFTVFLRGGQRGQADSTSRVKLRRAGSAYPSICGSAAQALGNSFEPFFSRLRPDVAVSTRQIRYSSTTLQHAVSPSGSLKIFSTRDGCKIHVAMSRLLMDTARMPGRRSAMSICFTELTATMHCIPRAFDIL